MSSHNGLSKTGLSSTYDSISRTLPLYGLDLCTATTIPLALLLPKGAFTLIPTAIFLTKVGGAL